MRISDWSSDVCSSDLKLLAEKKLVAARLANQKGGHPGYLDVPEGPVAKGQGYNDAGAWKHDWSQYDYDRSEEHTSELQSLMRISYAVFCLKKKKTQRKMTQHKSQILIDKKSNKA